MYINCFFLFFQMPFDLFCDISPTSKNWKICATIARNESCQVGTRIRQYSSRDWRLSQNSLSAFCHRKELHAEEHRVQVNSIETSLADKALFHRLGIRHCNSHHLSFHLLLVVQVYVEKVSVLIILRHRLLLLIPLWVIWRKPMLIAGNDAPLCALYVLLLP